MAKAQSILDEALQDAKLLEETAIEHARNVLAEAISPQIREFMDSHAGGQMSEMPAALSELDPETLEQILMLLKGAGGGAGMPGPEPEMGGLDVGLDASDEGGMFGGPPEEEDPEMLYGEPEEEEENEDEMLRGMYQREGNNPFDPDYKKSDEDEDKNKMSKKNEQTVKIDEADLAKAWAEVVKEEALEEAQVPSPTVAGGFADAQNPNLNATGGLGEKSAPGERGLEDKESETMWKDKEPTYAQDWTVKENAYKAQLQGLYNENQSIKTENSKLNVGVEKLQRSLTEVNLFNSKLLFTNKLLQNMNLTNEQRLTVIEAFDRAENLREVELVYKSLSESFKIAGVTLSEGKQPSSKKGRSSRFVTSATAGMLREQTERDENEGPGTVSEGWQRLAGLLGD